MDNTNLIEADLEKYLSVMIAGDLKKKSMWQLKKI